MRLTCRLIAWLLLALWLPATLHCGLEAADVFHPEDNGSEQGCCQGAAAEHNDECKTVESGEYRLEQGLPAVPVPVWVALDAWADLLRVRESAEEAVAQLSLSGAGRDPEWVPAWVFARRAAAPPRAPDSSLT